MDTTGIDPKIEGNSLIVNFLHINALTLIISQSVGTGYKGGDEIDIQFLNGSSTNWEYNALPEERGIQIKLDGLSEVYTICNAFKCAAMIIELRHKRRSNDEILEIIRTEFNEAFGYIADPNEPPFEV